MGNTLLFIRGLAENFDTFRDSATGHDGIPIVFSMLLFPASLAFQWSLLPLSFAVSFTS